MSAKKPNSTPKLLRILKYLSLAAILIFLAAPAFSQNTKGDRPINNQRKVRETKVKSVKKKEKGRTRDIANRRLRTKDQSSANRANAKYPQPSTYSNRTKKGEKAARPLSRVFSQSPRESRTRAWKGDVSGYPIKRIKPGKNDAARSNVYPQKGPYVRYARKQPSKRPPAYARTIRGTQFVKHTPRTRERAWIGGVDKGPIKNQSATGSVRNVYSQKGPYVKYYRKHGSKKEKPISNNFELATARELSRKPLTSSNQTVYPFSASRAFVKRGKKNVYWGKYSKKEKGYSGDLTGRELRTRNFKSSPAGLVGRDTIKTYGRKPSGDRASHLGGGYIPGTKRGQRGWKGDIAGWNLRKSRGKGEVAGKYFWPRKLSISGKGEKRGSKVPGSGFQTKSKRGEKAELKSISAIMLSRPLGAQPKGKKPPKKGGGSVKSAGWNNQGEPIQGRGPGPGSFAAARYSGSYMGQSRSFSQKGPGYSGNIKKSSFVGFSREGTNYSGKIKRSSIRGFSRDGTNYSGNIKRSSQRGFATGTDYSGRIKRSSLPGFSRDGTNYSGNIKRSSQRGFATGTDYSGRIKRSSISGFSRDGTNYSGNIKRSSQRGFATGTDYSGRIKRSSIRGFSRDGTNYSGNIKRSSQRGFATGTDYSGRIKRSSIRGFATGIDYSGRIRRSSLPGFSTENINYPGKIKRSSITPFTKQGADYSGNMKRKGGYAPMGEDFAGHAKRKRAEKGGGSVSGILWNNNNQALNGIPPGSDQGGKFSGHIKQKRPEKGGGSVSGKLWNNENQPLNTKPPLSSEANYSGRIKVSRFKKNYVQNPNSSKESMKKKTPDETTFKVEGLQVRVREKDYKKKPNASKFAMPGIAPTKSSVKASEYARSMKQYWHYKQNPNSATGALKVIAPGKANARIGDYQGNVKMHKYSDSRLHPDAQFAHGYRDNVKEERTILMNVKLAWSKLFRKSDTQPENVKEKVRRPRYDKKEKGLWNE